MSQTEVEDAETVDHCNVAMRAALKKGMDYCNTQDARFDVLGKNVGLSGSDLDFDADEVLEEGPEGSLLHKRQWVLAKADQIIATGGEDPLDAINEAWASVGDEMGDSGNGSDESEADDDVEAEEPEGDNETDLEDVLDEVDEDDVPEIEDDEE